MSTLSTSSGLIHHESLDQQLRERGYYGLNYTFNKKNHQLTLLVFICDPTDGRFVDFCFTFFPEIYYETVRKTLSDEGKLFGMIVKSTSHPGFYESKGPRYDIPYNPFK